MTHYTVGIIVPAKIRNIKAYIDRQMAPYEESADSPNPFWDWYRIGGRWDGWITGNEQSSDNGFNFDEKHETVRNNIATIEAALAKNKLPIAVITPDGEWHDRGDLWRFGLTDKELQKMHAKMCKLLRKYLGRRIVIIDAHI